MRSALALGIIGFSFVIASACGKSPAEDSQTHWLIECTDSDDCGSELTCLCGRCSSPCSEGDRCSVAGLTTQCFSTTSTSVEALCSATGASPLCLEACTRDSDCPGGRACYGGACLPRSIASGGAGASGGSGGSAGGGSTGGGSGGSTDGGGSGGAQAGSGTSSAGDGAGGRNCDCVVGAFVGVCGVDGRTYDAACGDRCVPVDIACRHICPCEDPGAGGTSVGGGAGIAGAGGGAPSCSATGESCAAGEACCSGLTCCTGIPVPAGAEFCAADCPDSDRALKQGFASVDQEEILERLATLPLSTWRYTTESSDRTHLGPMAQDFKATFGLGSDERTILQVDANGVAFAAIQALYARLSELEATNRALVERVRKLEAAPASE